MAWLAVLTCFGLFCCVTFYKGLTGAAPAAVLLANTGINATWEQSLPQFDTLISTMAESDTQATRSPKPCRSIAVASAEEGKEVIAMR